MNRLTLISGMLLVVALWAGPAHGTLSYGLVVDDEDIAFHTEVVDIGGDFYYESFHVFAGTGIVAFDPPEFISGAELPPVTADLDDFFEIEFTLSAPPGEYFEINTPATAEDVIFEVDMWYGDGSITLLQDEDKDILLDGAPYEDFSFGPSGVDPGGEDWFFNGEAELLGGQQLTFETLTLTLDYSSLNMTNTDTVTIEPRDSASISISSLHPVAEGEPDPFVQVVPEPGTLALLALAGALLLGIRAHAPRR